MKNKKIVLAALAVMMLVGLSGCKFYDHSTFNTQEDFIIGRSNGVYYYPLTVNMDGFVKGISTISLENFYFNDAGSLQISLVSPKGTEVILVKRNVDNKADYNNCTYTFEEKSFSSEEGLTVLNDLKDIDGDGDIESGTYFIDSSFSKFYGEPIAGTWKLKVFNYNNHDFDYNGSIRKMTIGIYH